MIFYIASSTYQEVIARTIREEELILQDSECSNEIYLNKYVRSNISKLTSLEEIVIDISALQDTDEEIQTALDMIRFMAYGIRIIIVAPNRKDGDALLAKCFQMGIYDIINTDDFLELKEELRLCLRQGKKYADAVKYKEGNEQETAVIKTEIKQKVSKVLVEIAGSEARIGTTHNTIILANYLRKKGYMVAIAEMNMSGAFKQIQENFCEKVFDDKYFSIGGVDFYPDSDSNQLASILGKSYNFILADFGDFTECDRVNFNKADVQIIIAGSKAWEITDVNRIFAMVDEETFKNYNYCFNFTVEKNHKDIVKSMKGVERVYFLKITEDPFTTYEFPGAEKILAEYMPIMTKSKKRGLFRRDK